MARCDLDLPVVFQQATFRQVGAATHQAGEPARRVGATMGSVCAVALRTRVEICCLLRGKRARAGAPSVPPHHSRSAENKLGAA